MSTICAVPHPVQGDGAAHEFAGMCGRWSFCWSGWRHEVGVIEKGVLKRHCIAGPKGVWACSQDFSKVGPWGPMGMFGVEQ